MKAEQAEPRIEQLVAVADRLRTARKACRQFLALWAMQRGAQIAVADRDDDVSDPMNHDWSLLYRGSVLDD
jgi:hypothetical protein